MYLTSDNYNQGLLVDDELIAGVTEATDQPGKFMGFVLNHATGEYLAHQIYTNLASALNAVNGVQRNWVFEATGGCGEGSCSIGGCGQGVCKKGACQLFLPADKSSS